MINFAENLNKMITAGLGGETEAPQTEVAVGHRIQYLDASGPVASFETNIVAPLKKLLVTMLPIQAGSGDPSPDNIRPISGFDSVSVTRTGINIWDEVWEVGSISGTTGINTNATDRIRSVNYIAVKPGTTYFLNGPHTVGLRFYDFDKNFLGYSTKINSSFITQENCYYIRFIILATTEYDYDTSINYPASDHDYHPGTVQSASIQLGDTVYGGTLDVTAGKLTVDKVKRVFDGSESWGTNQYYPNTYSLGRGNLAPNPSNPICNYYPKGALSSNYVFTIGTVINIRDSRFSTTEDFKSYLADCYANGKPIEIVSALSTPIVIDLTPEKITTLIGKNNVWSDAGNVDVTYIYYEETEGY